MNLTFATAPCAAWVCVPQSIRFSEMILYLPGNLARRVSFMLDSIPHRSQLTMATLDSP